MPTLDYQVQQPRSSVSAALCLLITLPIVSAAFTLLSAINWVAEPFGSVEPREVVLFGGAPVVAVGCAIAWCLIARKRRVPWAIYPLALLWFSFMFYGSIHSLLPYFQEPWNK